ncbi:glycosyltransferase family 2 protein [Halobaculum sp. EA56]|uniref:glycosyltransferase family 2 protein n=1 Tax=Halobaculum sp. EA56 TaxID=3421648 RepID=UPI003EBC9E0E
MRSDRTAVESGLVSVIIPTYDDDEYLPRAVESVVELQDYTPIEIVLVDSAESDVAAQLSEDHRNVRHVHAPPEGPGAARNEGISASSGEFIAFLDADDEWLEGKISKQVDRLRQTGSGFSFTEEYVITEDGNEVRLSGISFPKGEPPHEYYFKKGTGIGSRTVVVRREFLLDERFDEELEAREDPHLWTRILRRTDPVKVSEPLAVKHERGNSLTSDEELVWRSERKAIVDLAKRFPELERYRDTRLQEADYRFGKRLLIGRESNRARRTFLSSLREHGPDTRMLVLLVVTFVPYIQPELVSILDELSP